MAEATKPKGKTRVGLSCEGMDYVVGVPHPYMKCCEQCHNQANPLNAGHDSHRMQWTNISAVPGRPESIAFLCCVKRTLAHRIQISYGWEKYRNHLIQKAGKGL